MKCKYPAELLPKSNYRQNILEDKTSSGLESLSINDLGKYYLMHTLEGGISLHSSYQLSEHFKDYFKPDRFVNGMSMNLVSVFRKKHAQYIVDYKSNNDAKDPWKVGDISVIPFRKLKRRKAAGYFGMKIADIMKITKKLPILNQEGAKQDTFLISTVVEHCPTKCNYWHFEIYLYAEDQDNPIDKYKGKMPDLAKNKIISKNQARVVPGLILQEFKKIAKMRSEIVEFHIPEKYYLG